MLLKLCWFVPEWRNRDRRYFVLRTFRLRIHIGAGQNIRVRFRKMESEEQRAWRNAVGNARWSLGRAPAALHLDGLPILDVMAGRIRRVNFQEIRG